MEDVSTKEQFIEIRLADVSELDVLHSIFNPDDRFKYHHKRYQVQEKGEGVYLIAWHGYIPLGHFLLRWNGPDTDKSGKYPYPTPSLEAGGTRVEHRRKGVATKLIREAERLVREKGFTRIGLAVGSIDNPDAKRLYEKLGYKDWEKPEFTVSWDYIDKTGKTGSESEVCIYMFKNL